MRNLNNNCKTGINVYDWQRLVVERQCYHNSHLFLYRIITIIISCNVVWSTNIVHSSTNLVLHTGFQQDGFFKCFFSSSSWQLPLLQISDSCHLCFCFKSVLSLVQLMCLLIIFCLFTKILFCIISCIYSLILIGVVKERGRKGGRERKR